MNSPGATPFARLFLALWPGPATRQALAAWQAHRVWRPRWPVRGYVLVPLVQSQVGYRTLVRYP